MEETSGRKEGSLFQDRQTCNRCGHKRATNHSLQVTLTECLIQIICKVSGSRRRLSRTRHPQVEPEPHDLPPTLVTEERRAMFSHRVCLFQSLSVCWIKEQRDVVRVSEVGVGCGPVSTAYATGNMIHVLIISTMLCELSMSSHCFLYLCGIQPVNMGN